MKSNRPLIRLTFSQERYNILIRKQRNGNASFNDLIELDEIVNRDPAIRESILEEMQEIDNPTQGRDKPDIIIPEQFRPVNLLQQIRAFINKLFMIATHLLKPAL
ncbi:hypothetical protein [Mucilaginibacter sp.]|uniref:hypothetical protein n=1 Tax=Mucilaginibacter sp. TaxID=1882438 RepID=UPI0035BC6EEA